MRLRAAFFLLFITLTNSPAHAISLVLEPYLGPSLGAYSQSPTNGFTTGLYVGAIADVTFLDDRLFAGLNFRYGTVSYKASGSTASDRFSHLLLGVRVGYRFRNISMRLWVAYDFTDRITGDLTRIGVTSSTTFTGGAFQVGASSPIFSWANVILAFSIHNYTEQGGVAAVNSKLQNIDLFVALSFPISFLF